MMTECMLPAVASQIQISSIEGYIQYANSIPLLSKEKEQELTNQFYKVNDLKAAQKLVLAHLRYVVRVAKGYMGYGLALGDLIQEGTVGLMKAVKKFQPAKGVRLVTFAMHWIKAEIHEFVIRNWRLVKVATTKAQRKLFFKLRSMKKDLGWLTKTEISEIAADLEVKPAEVELMEARLSYKDTPFDLPENAGSEEESDSRALAPVEYLEDKQANPAVILENLTWDHHIKAKFYNALNQLDARTKSILQQRWLQGDGQPKATLEQLSLQFGVSKERIRQIESQAIKQIREEFAN